VQTNSIPFLCFPNSIDRSKAQHCIPILYSSMLEKMDRTMESMKATEMKEVFFCHTFLLFRDNRVFISFVSLKDRQGDKEAFAEGSGNVW